MTISLTYRDLKRIALHGSTIIEGVTVKVERPLLASLITSPSGPTGSVTFRLDDSDPKAIQAAEEPM